MDRDAFDRWIRAYGQAWRDRDAAAAARLFSDDAVYDSHPFREPHRGRQGVVAYWGRATRDQRNLDVRFGRALLDGDRAAVEWWAIMEVKGEGTVTLPGCLLLRFDRDGRCAELREYWTYEAKRIEPRENWGR